MPVQQKELGNRSKKLESNNRHYLNHHNNHQQGLAPCFIRPKMPTPFDFSEPPKKSHFATIVRHSSPDDHKLMAQPPRDDFNHRIIKRALTLANERPDDLIGCLVSLNFHWQCLTPVHHDMSVPNGLEMAALCSRAAFLRDKYRRVNEFKDTEFDTPLFKSVLDKIASHEPKIIENLRQAIAAKDTMQITDYLYYSQAIALDHAKAYFESFSNREAGRELDLRDISPHPGQAPSSSGLPPP